MSAQSRIQQIEQDIESLRKLQEELSSRPTLQEIEQDIESLDPLSRHQLFLKMLKPYGFTGGYGTFQLCDVCGAKSFANERNRGFHWCNMRMCHSCVCDSCIREGDVHTFDDRSEGYRAYGVLVCKRHKTCDGCEYEGWNFYCKTCSADRSRKS